MQPGSSCAGHGIYSIPQPLEIRKKGPGDVLNLSELSVPDSLDSPRSPFNDEPYSLARIFGENAGAVVNREWELTIQLYVFFIGFSIRRSKSSVRPLKSGARTSPFAGIFRKARNGQGLFAGGVPGQLLDFYEEAGFGQGGPCILPRENSK